MTTLMKLRLAQYEGNFGVGEELSASQWLCSIQLVTFVVH